MIYEIRGKQVMLDSDLAKLYQCTNGTKDVNKAVKRNLSKFPNDFYFQLIEEEWNILRFQFGTANKIRTLPFCFTEQGVAMLATILRTSVAAEVSVQIMRAFVTMRKIIGVNLLEQKYINNLVLQDNKRIDLLEETFSKFEEKEKNHYIFFEGEIYDAYSLLVDILEKAKENIIIIDNYIDKKVLDVLAKVKKKIIIITKNIEKITVEKYKKQYNNVTIIIKNSFHDRFIIIDEKVLYHCGASFKDLGKKCFAINKIEDKKYLLQLLDYIQEKVN